MAIAEKKDLYTFPSAPDATSPEWPGTPIGAKNTITRTKGRTLVHDKTVDAKPGLFKRLLANAFEHIATARETTYSHDVVIHGLRVRAITNSDHLIRVHALIRLFVKQALHHLLHQGHARRTTHEHNFIDVTRGETRIAERLLTGVNTTFDEILDHLLKFGACQLHQQMLWTARIGGNKRQVDFGLSHRR